MKCGHVFFIVLACVLLISVPGVAQESDPFDQDQIAQLAEALKNHNRTLVPLGLTKAAIDSFQGDRCGEFFVLVYMSDEIKLLCMADMYVLLFSIDRYVIVLDEEAKEYPTVRLVQAPGLWPTRYKFLVRMSKKLYDASPCLPMPSPVSEWNVK